MDFDRETKNMIATLALVAAFAFGINAVVTPDAETNFMSWSIGLFVIAVLFWIWIRRDDLAEKREDALKAAEDAAKRAEELAKAAQDKASVELEKGKQKVEILAEEVKDSTEKVAEVVDDAAADVAQAVADETGDIKEIVEEQIEAVEETVEETVEDTTDDLKVEDVVIENPVENSPEPVEAIEPDDLSKIEGIGPVYRTILTEAGVGTFQAITTKTTDELELIIADAGKRRPASIDTWVEQAEYAAKGDWDGLRKFQDMLIGGRRPPE